MYIHIMDTVYICDNALVLFICNFLQVHMRLGNCIAVDAAYAVQY